MLAPYTASQCSYANQSTGMKTGGRKKNIRGGGGPIPKISDAPIVSVQKGVVGAIDGFSSFMEKLDEDYLKSVEAVKSMKIGNQRLIQGGAKSKTKTKSKTASKTVSKSKSKSKTTSKSKTASKSKVKKGGSNGSDFSTTLNSRGPSNAPDDYWGVPGETWFRQFNKTGDYIPNSKLAIAATPSLVGKNNDIVVGYNEMDLNYPSF